jgi:alpha-L-fucosidase 2
METLAILLFGVSIIQSTTLPGTRMNIDWSKLVSEQDIIITTPPDDTVSGLLLGNGDIGVSMFGSPTCITFQVGKNDIWDYRDPMDEKRPVTQKEFIEKYANPNSPPISSEYLLNENVDRDNVTIRNTYLTPMPTSKPAGRIRFRNSSLADATYYARLHLWNAELTTEIRQTKSVEMNTFVSYPRNLIIVQYTPSAEEKFDIELARHKDSTGMIPNSPEFGASGRDIWIRYKFPADPTNYPQGFEYVMYGRVIGGEEVHTDTNEEFAVINQWVWERGTPQTVEGISVAHVKSSSPVTLLVALATTRDDPDPFARAKRDVDDAQQAGMAKLTQEHQEFWHDYWQRSFVQLLDKPFLTQQWFLSQYQLACCWRPGRIAPGLFGSWAWEDFPAFGNDYHWDYNMQQAVWGAYSSNHLEQTIPYTETALALLPTAKMDARETYGIDGAKFFLSSYPRKYAHNPFPLIHYDRMMSLSAWVAQPLWWYYVYSQDKDYLRTAYPLMRDCAKFYEGFLTHASDGKYDIWPTAVWDVYLSPHLKLNKNCQMDLAFIHYLMKACITASEILGVDADRRLNWQNISDNLREYPTTDTPDGKVFAMFEGTSVSDYVFPVTTMAIFPGDDIGLHSPDQIREIAWRTMKAIPYHNAGELVLTAMARVRLGKDELDPFWESTKSTRLANGGLVINGWRNNIWVHGCGLPIVINESILQSYTGQLRVSPVKLKTGVRFGQLRAVGAFLVSGEIREGGQIAYITITSEVGNPCLLIRPWDGDVRIRELSSMKTVLFEETDGVLSFQTEKGATYIVDSQNDPWEMQPIANDTGTEQ